MVRNKFKLPKTFLPIILLIAFCLPLTATVRYVSHNGSNTPPYISWATAADSIMSAINISVFGDTIYVANGVYKERVDMIPGLTLIGTGMDSTIIDTREFQFSSGFYSVRVSDSCYFAGFQIITYDDTHGFGIYILDWDIEFVNATVEYNKIMEAVAGIEITTSSLGFDGDNKLVRMNIIKNVQDGITSAQTDPMVEENIIYPTEYGLISQLNSSPTYLNNIIIFSNVIGISGFAGSNDFISILKNNLFYGRGSYGMRSYYDTLTNNIVYGKGGKWGHGYHGAGSEIKNNHIEKTSIGLYHDTWSTPPPVYQYNNMWDNDVNFENYSPDTTNIYVDPMFVNEDSLDFHLQMFSPLIDAGDPNILDVDGTRSDIGLYGGPFGERYAYFDLAPKPPRNLSAVVDSEYITISWNTNTEADFKSYKLFRDTTANFAADSTTFVIELTDTFYQHIIPPKIDAFYYKLTAADNQGNESEPSEELAVIITSVDDYPAVVSNYQLYQNYPNPFNPSTKIGYKLKERGYVKLYVYDIKGELVSVLVNETQDSGYYEAEFNAGVGPGLRPVLASGMYIYQIMVRSENNIPVFTDMKKMIMIK